GRYRTKARGEPGPARQDELLGVDLDAEPESERRAQEPLGLADGEESGLAEDVAVAGEPLPRDAGKGVVDQPVDVGIGPGAVLGRDRVRSKEGRHEAKSGATSKSGDEAEKAQLALRRESVAGFHLDRGRPPTAHPSEPGAGGGEEVLVRGPASGSHGRVEAAAGAGDLGVSHSSDLERELEGPVAGKEDVRVRVDEPGHDGAAARRNAPAAGPEANGPR